MRAVRRTVFGAASAATLALAAFAGALITIRVLGFSAAVVMGGSMAPAIPMGSLIVIQPISPDRIGVGDVITFSLPDRLITHRVVAVSRDESGSQIMTKGDANDVADPIAIRAGNAVGAVRLTVPLVGYALAELQSWWRAVAGLIVLGIALDAARRRIARGRPGRGHRTAAAAA